jgi:hypothetical protein
MTTYDVTCQVVVRVRVNNPNVIDRCVNDEDGWRTRMFYSDLIDRDAVLGHLAFNCAVNGLEVVAGLDGWADLTKEDAAMEVNRGSFEVLDVDVVGA